MAPVIFTLGMYQGIIGGRMLLSYGTPGSVMRSVNPHDEARSKGERVVGAVLE